MTKNSTIPIPTRASVLRLRKYQVRLNWAMRGFGRRPRFAGVAPGVGGAVGSGTLPSGVAPAGLPTVMCDLSQPDPRVEVGVEDVDDDVRHHDDDGEQKGRAEDQTVIDRGQDRQREQQPDALQLEHSFDDRESSDEARERQAEDRDRHVEGVPPRVLADDDRLGDSLRPGCPDEIEVHHLQHAVADEPEDPGDRTVRDGEGGEDLPVDRLPREAPVVVDQGVDRGESGRGGLQIGTYPTRLNIAWVATLGGPGPRENRVRGRAPPADRAGPEVPGEDRRAEQEQEGPKERSE